MRIDFLDEISVLTIYDYCMAAGIAGIIIVFLFRLAEGSFYLFEGSCHHSLSPVDYLVEELVESMVPLK